MFRECANGRKPHPPPPVPTMPEGAPQCRSALR
jgi:hypothetical protein